MAWIRRITYLLCAFFLVTAGKAGAQAIEEYGPQLSIDSATETSITLSWPPLQDTYRHELRRGGFIVSSALSDPSTYTYTFQNSGLSCGTAYSYQLWSYKENEIFAFARSNIVSPSTNSCPGAGEWQPGRVEWEEIFDPPTATDLEFRDAVVKNGALYAVGANYKTGSSRFYAGSFSSVDGGMISGYTEYAYSGEADRGYGITVDDAGIVYMVGSNDNGDERWKIIRAPNFPYNEEKWIRHSNPTGGDDVALDVAVDATGIYVVGHQGNGQYGRIEKRDHSGNLLWSRTSVSGEGRYLGVVVYQNEIYTMRGRSFGGGQLTVEKWSQGGTKLFEVTRAALVDDTDAYAGNTIEVDSTGIYVAAYDGILKFTLGGSLMWQSPEGGNSIVRDNDTILAIGGLKKINAETGAPVWSSTQSPPQTYGMALDDSGLFVVGGSGIAKLEKEQGEGSMIWGVTVPGFWGPATGVVADETGVYVSGHTVPVFQVNPIGYIEKRGAQDGSQIWSGPSPFANSSFKDLEEGEGTVYAAGGFGAWHMSSRAKDSGVGGNLGSPNLDVFGIAEQDGNLYSVGAGPAGWRLEKRSGFNPNTVWEVITPISGGGIAHDLDVYGSSIYVAGYQGSDRAQAVWTVRKHNESNGALLWEKTLPSYYYNIPRDVKVNSSGVFVAGTRGFTGMVEKRDTSGNMVWSATPLAALYGLALDEGRVYAVGTIGINDDKMYMEARSQNDGTLLWVKAFDVVDNKRDVATAVDVEGEFIYISGVVGLDWGNVTRDPIFYSGEGGWRVEKRGVQALDSSCGLKAYDGTEVVEFACGEPAGTLILRMSGSGGEAKALYLTSPTDPTASKFRIFTQEGIKALKQRLLN